MDYMINLDKDVKKESVEKFIDEKVDDMIERSIVEGRKRKVIENKVQVNVVKSDIKNMDLLVNIGDFDEFPKYKGRGYSEIAPDIQGSLEEKKMVTMILWYVSVSLDEKNAFEKSIEDAGFKKEEKEYVKTVENRTYSMSISYSEKDEKIRIYHKVVINEN